MIFGKFGGLSSLVAFLENQLARQEQINYFKYEHQRVHEVPHTIGCKMSQGIVC